MEMYGDEMKTRGGEMKRAEMKRVRTKRGSERKSTKSLKQTSIVGAVKKMTPAK